MATTYLRKYLFSKKGESAESLVTKSENVALTGLALSPAVAFSLLRFTRKRSALFCFIGFSTYLCGVFGVSEFFLSEARDITFKHNAQMHAVQKETQA